MSYLFMGVCIFIAWGYFTMGGGGREALISVFLVLESETMGANQHLLHHEESKFVIVVPDKLYGLALSKWHV